jgi:phosphoglycerate dehydrogenase-like enzyme
VGIVGFGGIGRRLAELLAPFRTPIRIYDPFVPVEVAQKAGVQTVELMELIRESDVVVLCAANTNEAAHLIDATAIAALRKDAVLVNVGRSMLVDMPALIARLEQRDLVAMLDVFDQEPLEADSPLRRLPNAYLTPHRAGGIYASVQRSLAMLADDLEAFLAGRERRYAVTDAMMQSFPG